MYLIQVAELTNGNDLLSETEFDWWCLVFLRHSWIIIYKVKSHYCKLTHKYGIHVPKSVEQAVWIDKENFNTIRQDYMNKDTNNNIIAFDVREEVKTLQEYIRRLWHI